jgi:hypothetical protein
METNNGGEILPKNLWNKEGFDRYVTTVRIMTIPDRMRNTVYCNFCSTTNLQSFAKIYTFLCSDGYNGLRKYSIF